MKSQDVSLSKSREYVDFYWLMVLLLLTGGLRFAFLDATPMHHDESIHAWFSYRLSTGEPYTYDPVYHGPFLYWSTSLLFKFFGDSDVTARLLPAAFSSALIILCWSLRSELGKIGWIVSALFISLSPTFTYYGRFLGHDNYVAFFTLSIVILTNIFIKCEKRVHLCLLGIISGCFIATKACFYLHLGIFAFFFILILLLDTFGPEMQRSKLIGEMIAILRRNRRSLLYSGGLFLLTYILLYSSFFSHWPGVIGGVVQTISYWGGQQLHPRIPGPFYYYLPRLLLHEPVVYLVIPAVIWAGSKAVRPFDLFLAYWTLAAFIVYSFAQEKVPWLLMHILLPMILLSGRYVQSLAQGKKIAPWVLLSLTCLFGWSLRENTWLSFRASPDQPHLLKYMATGNDIKEVVRKLSIDTKFADQRVVTGKAIWPLAWYLRGEKITYSLQDKWEDSAKIVIADENEIALNHGFFSKTYMLNSWWQPDYNQLLTSGLYPYLVKRTAIGQEGAYNFTMLTRNE